MASGRARLAHFQRFSFDRAKYGRRATDPPHLTITPDLLSLNRAAYAALGIPRHVELYCDPATREIAIRPVATATPCSYTVRTGYPHAVTATAFLRHHGLRPAATVRVPAEIAEGVLFATVPPDA